MGISIQFHATPAENAAFCADVRTRFGVFLYGLTSKPFSLGEIEEAGAPDLFQYRRIVFSSFPLRSTHESKDFYESNRDVLMLEIGSLTPDGLRESWLTSMASGDSEKIWRRAVKLMKDRTEAGAYAVNPQTEACVFLRNHRYTPGAQELVAAGVAMLPAAGSAVYRLKGKDS